MAKKHFWIEWDGDDAIMRSLVVGHDRITDGVQDMMNDIAKRGETFMMLYAPSYSGEFLRRIGRTDVHRSVGANGIDYSAAVGVGPGSPHPLYAHMGTGLYRRNSPDLIRPRGNKPLTFQKRGEDRRFRMWVRGQKPNPFVKRAYDLLVPYARIRTEALAGRTFRRLAT